MKYFYIHKHMHCFIKPQLKRSTFNITFSLFVSSDVAIGAPKEDDYGGAVYIYHGDATGITRKYSMVNRFDSPMM